MVDKLDCFRKNDKQKYRFRLLRIIPILTDPDRKESIKKVSDVFAFVDQDMRNTTREFSVDYAWLDEFRFTVFMKKYWEPGGRRRLMKSNPRMLAHVCGHPFPVDQPKESFDKDDDDYHPTTTTTPTAASPRSPA